jgi:hypothetical protein
MVHLGSCAGVVVRAQGLRRYYGARVTRDGMFQLVRQYDEICEVMASEKITFAFDKIFPISLTVSGSSLSASIGSTTLVATDNSNFIMSSGAIGLMVADGAASANTVRVTAPKEAIKWQE